MPLELIPYLLCVFAFVLGSVPFGLIAGKLRGVDLREQGSKNIGATNTLRVLGTVPGVIVLILDMAKGLIPVLVGKSLGLSSWWFVAAGMSAMLGHIFSPFLGFKGGKGVATGIGVGIALSPLVALASVAVFLATVTVTRYVSLGSILGAVTLAALFWLLPPTFLTGDPLPYRLFATLAAVFIVVRHKSNIARIRDGSENKFGKKKE